MALKIGPGRLGNLTLEQEAKLQELWTVTLRVFGVPPRLADTDGIGYVEGAEDSDAGKPAQDTPHDSSSAKKKGKRRIPLFGKKHQAEASTLESASSTPKNSDADDKYGQTKEFEQAIASLSPEDLRNAFWSMVKHDHPDNLLLRFLRARKWDVEKALVMLISTMHWRSQEMHVDDDVIKRGEGGAAEDAKSSDHGVKKEGEDFLAQVRLGKSYLHGIDKEGRPMCFVRVRLHKAGEQSEASLERYTVYVIETARLVLSPPVDTAAVIFDMTGFSMANMDYAPVKFMIKCFEANYPESLGVVLVHKAPWIFQGIWSIIKGWLDPVVAAKIHFTKNVDELETYISSDRIPKELGGDEDWTYHYPEPEPHENAQMKEDSTRTQLLESRKTTVEEFERATQRWLSAGAAGQDLKGLQAEKNTLADQLKEGYWKLDPYLRARTVYDRTKMIQGDGRIVFYEEKEKITLGKGPEPTNGQKTSDHVPHEDDVD